jgi:hypothetical protein
MRLEKRAVSGGILGVVGYLLSPLSWWNDLYINIPLAYAGGWLVSLVYKTAFMPAFLLCYWITNIAGFVMMHKGICKLGGKQCDMGSYTKKDLVKDVAWTVAYTVLMVILAKLEVVHLIDGHFTPHLPSRR